MYNVNGSPTLTNVTFTSNSATFGGGMYNDGVSPTIRNIIFWGNTATFEGPQVYKSSGTVTISDSVIQGGCPGGGFTCSGVLITADPLLGTLGNYGGSTPTIPILGGSSAIDQGNTAVCPSTDQREKPRLGRCDIGAFEFQGYTLIKTGGDRQTTLVTLPFAQSLAVTLKETDTSSPVASIPITFTAPTSGASATWSGSYSRTATTNASGIATVDAPVANGVLGAFEVSVSARVDPPRATASTLFFLTNTQANTTTSLTSSTNPSLSGQAVTLTATVSGSSPTGTITFQDDGAAVTNCTAVSLSGGMATCTLSSLAVGTHTLTVSYNGDTTNAASTESLAQVVNKASTTTSLTSSSNPSVSSQAVILTATVSGNSPTGSIRFQDGGTTVPGCESVPLIGSIATCTLSSPSVGAHTITAEYSGDATHTADVGTLTQVVNKASTTTTLTSSPNPSTTADTILLTVTVRAVAPASGTPTGTVQLQETVSLSAPIRLSRQTRAAQTLVNGVATFSISPLDAGSHNLVAVYSGDTQHHASTSPALTHLVNAFHYLFPFVGK